MPITRTPMVDDDGSGTTGTIINNAWKQELYGQIDAALAALNSPWTAFDPHVIHSDTTTVTKTFYTCQWRRLTPDTVIWVFAINPMAITVAAPPIFITDLPFTCLDQYQVSPIGFGSFPWRAKPDAYNSFKTVGFYRQDALAWPAGNQFVEGSLILKAS